LAPSVKDSFDDKIEIKKEKTRFYTKISEAIKWKTGSREINRDNNTNNNKTIWWRQLCHRGASINQLESVACPSISEKKNKFGIKEFHTVGLDV
jgi:hypothetical protein